MKRFIASLALVLSAVGCAPLPEPSPDQRIVIDNPGSALRFAAIGDFGRAGEGEAAVASMVASWNPDLVITLGDNNYPSGAQSTLDANVGQYYHQFIAPYEGAYGDGAQTNRFFPSLGNHDWMTWRIAPYLEYFELPGNERYYDFRWGPVHFFALDTDASEPDGRDAQSVQAKWLQQKLSASEAPYRIVYMHHPPYSSGRHGSEEVVRWPYFEWGASLVISGHDHHYERIERPEGTYVVNGLGGYKAYKVRDPVEGSKVRFNERFGAMRAEATPQSLVVEFIDVTDNVVDRFEIANEAATPAASFESYDD